MLPVNTTIPETFSPFRRMSQEDLRSWFRMTRDSWNCPSRNYLLALAPARHQYLLSSTAHSPSTNLTLAWSCYGPTLFIVRPKFPGVAGPAKTKGTEDWLTNPFGACALIVNESPATIVTPENTTVPVHADAEHVTDVTVTVVVPLRVTRYVLAAGAESESFQDAVIVVVCACAVTGISSNTNRSSEKFSSFFIR